jgi:integrase
LAVAFAGWLGPRISEAFGLQWHDMDFGEGVVSFRRGLVEGRITPLKTEASRNPFAHAGGSARIAAAVAIHHSLQPTGDWIFASSYTRADVRFGLHNCSRLTSSRWQLRLDFLP